MLATVASRAVQFLRSDRKRARLNRKLGRYELRRQRLRLRSRPWNLTIDPATMCNLKCPFCPTGNGSTKVKKALLAPEAFRQMVANVDVGLIFSVFFYNWGEPLLNSHVIDYVSYFSERGIETEISTNFSLRGLDDAFMAELVRSGLGTLLVGMDGATQETYARYRVKGDLQLVLGNVRRLSEVKKRLGSESPRIVSRMLLNRFNEPEAEEGRRLAEEVGAVFTPDENFWVPPGLHDEWTAESVKQRWGTTPPTPFGRARNAEINTICRQLWDSLVVNADGGVFPCCAVDDPAVMVGNLLEQPVDAIWNSEKMITLRRYVTDREAPAPSFRNACVGCEQRYCTFGATMSCSATPG